MKISYGMELELPDIDKKIVPEHLGKPEFCEYDVVNTKEPYKNVAVDPAGINPPVGGEINTIPSYGVESQVKIVKEIFDFYNNDFGVTAVGHFHIHIMIEEWKENLDILKNILKYMNDNYHHIIDLTYFTDDFRIEMEKIKPLMEDKYFKKSFMFMKNDGGRRIPEWLFENIMNASTYEEMLETMKIKDGKKLKLVGRSFVNALTLQQIGTLEFRFIRSTNNIEEVRGALEMIRDIVIESQKENPLPFVELFELKQWKLPPSISDTGQFESWCKSKEEAGKKGVSGGSKKNRELLKPMETEYDEEFDLSNLEDFKKEESFLDEF